MLAGLRQKDCHEFEANLEYTVNCRLAYGTRVRRHRKTTRFFLGGRGHVLGHEFKNGLAGLILCICCICLTVFQAISCISASTVQGF